MLGSAILYQLVPFLEAVLLLSRHISHFRADALKRDALARPLYRRLVPSCGRAEGGEVRRGPHQELKWLLHQLPVIRRR